jgi:hypothetical protein
MLEEYIAFFPDAAFGIVHAGKAKNHVSATVPTCNIQRMIILQVNNLRNY